MARTYDAVYYAKREDNESIPDLLTKGRLVELDAQEEPQGEAICFDEGNHGYYTLSKKRSFGVYIPQFIIGGFQNSKIYRYHLYRLNILLRSKFFLSNADNLIWMNECPKLHQIPSIRLLKLAAASDLTSYRCNNG